MSGVARHLAIVAELIEQTCGECGCVWGFPTELRKQRLKDGKPFYCPNGHGRRFTQGNTEEDKLRRENQRLKQEQAYLEDSRRRAIEDAERQRRRANGYKGHATRITKRAKAGICPCCNRTFQQLARHMATQHPTFTPLEVIEGGKSAVQS
jgi:hypothetical protein